MKAQSEILLAENQEETLDVPVGNTVQLTNQHEGCSQEESLSMC
jgi:hypothetical protein